MAPELPVRLAGDAVCMALGEHWRGAGQGVSFLLGMVVSTGWAAGWYSTAPRTTGEPATPDTSAMSSSIRTARRVRAAATAAWRRSPVAHGWRAGPASTAGRPDRMPTPRSWPTPQLAGDALALRHSRRAATAVAAMIASVGAVCDLDFVVIGGGVAKSGALLFDPLREALARYARLDFIAGLQVLPAELGGDAGLVGAAALLRA